jgi:NADPH:quinone reductase-like Zn-dependent oxidoreductase
MIAMARAVRFDAYGDVNVLQVVEVPQPHPGPGEVTVEVVAAGINPGEIAIRTGALEQRYPGKFPSGQGSDFAGKVVEVGTEVTFFSPGDEVIGWSDWRSSQADFVTVPTDHLIMKPAAVDWDQAGALFVAGVTAFAAVRAVDLHAGDTVAVSAAAGGVGSIAIQLATLAGATVLGIAGEDRAQWLRSMGVEPVRYGDGLAERLRALKPNAFVDCFGGGYVDLAVELGIAPERIDTIIDYEAAQRTGAKTEASSTASTTEALGYLAGLVASGDLVVPVAGTFPIEDVRQAYTQLADRHTLGKIVLRLR